MAAEGKKIAVGVFCADWRLHQDCVHLNNKVKARLGVDGVDELVVAGPEGVLKNPARANEIEPLVCNLQVLIDAHHPTALAFVGHQQCAGHSVSNEEHEADIALMAKEFKAKLKFAGEVVAFVATYTNDSEWGLKEVALTAQPAGAELAGFVASAA